MLNRSLSGCSIILIAFVAICINSSLALQQPQHLNIQQGPQWGPLRKSHEPEIEGNFPAYIQSPRPLSKIVDRSMARGIASVPQAPPTPSASVSNQVSNPISPQMTLQLSESNSIDHLKPPSTPPVTAIQSTQTTISPQIIIQAGQQQQQPQTQSQTKSPDSQASKQPVCLTDNKLFNAPEECLSTKNYASLGLPAFKNEDLLKKRGFEDRDGCVFILSNGLFKNFNVNKSSFCGDSKCLDSSKGKLMYSFSNVTLSYLWELRCINKADQLLDDSAFEVSSSQNVCVGSSQSIGFVSLQVNSLEAEIEFATDIYKNWRIKNVAVDMLSPLFGGGKNGRLSTARSGNTVPASINTQSGNQSSVSQHQDKEVDSSSPSSAAPAAGLRDFHFEMLDGDEMNWRYQNLFSNWSRNKLHVNFIDQFKRFLWISLQRCLNDATIDARQDSATGAVFPELFVSKQI